jgi:hypothetical protein
VCLYSKLVEKSLRALVRVLTLSVDNAHVASLQQRKSVVRTGDRQPLIHQSWQIQWLPSFADVYQR